jgi:hypothetical protein
MAEGVSVESRDLKKLARDLQRIKPRVDREMTRAHREVSTDVANAAQRNVAGLPGPSERGASGIQAQPTPSKGVIALLGSNRFTFSAVFGTEVHWVFGRPMRASEMARRVWQPWVGTNWTPEEGLYGVSPAIQDAMPKVLDTYSERMMAALAEAFPEGSNG